VTTFTGTIPTIASGDTTTVPTNLATYRDALKALTEAESTWSPTITAETGTFTSVAASNCRYLQANKLVIWTATITITTAGTAAGAIRMPLPVTAQSGWIYLGNGRETTATGSMLQAFQFSSTVASIVRYDNATIIASGRALTVMGHYEAA
jgi:hypothetical protein